MPLVGYRVGSRNSLRSTVHFLKFPEPFSYSLFHAISTDCHIHPNAPGQSRHSCSSVPSNSQVKPKIIAKTATLPKSTKTSSCLHVTFLNSDVIFPSGSPGLLQRRAAHPCGSSQEGGEGGAHCWIFLWGTTSR